MDKVVDTIWAGKPPPEDANSHIKQVKKLFLDKLTIQSTGEVIQSQEIAACTNELELITLLRPHFCWIPLPPEEQKLKKCSKLSTMLRERGNEAYKSGNLKGALRGYNLALTFSPLNSPEMGLAFGNRSALFIHLKQFELALKDIDYAIKNNFPENLLDKLEQRRDKCLQQEKKTRSKGDKKTKANEEYFSKNFFSLKNPHDTIPGAESFVEIDYREDRGRRLVAREDIPAGTLILMDKPFVNVINNLLTWDLQHCHHCSKQLLAGLPCELCTFTIYCDETCRAKSCEGSHKYEHEYLSHLHPISEIIRHRHLQALRLMGIVGPEELRKLFGRHCNNFSEEIAPNMHEPLSYQTIYNLISHGMQNSLCDKISDVFQALYLTHLLKNCSPFFCGDKEDNLPFENFVSSSILHHVWNIKYNAISLSKLEHCSGGVGLKGGEVSTPFATAVYPLISLCNHSCDPNVAPVKKFQYLETALITLKYVCAGEELCITYKPLFTNMKTNERLSFLQQNYNFLCNCPPCARNWSLKNLKSIESLLFQLDSNEKCLDCFNGANKKPCETCVKKRLNEMVGIEELENQLYAADKLIKTGQFVESIKILKPCLDHCTRYMDPCHSLTQVAMDLFKRALVRLGNEVEGFTNLH